MSAPGEVEGVPGEAVKPQAVRKPPSPHLPRLFAALAIITLLAVPVVVPVVVMKVTGKTGRKGVELEDAIEAPPPIVAVAPEEVTQEEVKESFLKLQNSKVRGSGRDGRSRRGPHAAGASFQLLQQTMGGLQQHRFARSTMHQPPRRSGSDSLGVWGAPTPSLGVA
jgi:hypothetical protein